MVGAVTAKRRKMLGKAGVGALLIAAALVLSGCWENIFKLENGGRVITLTRDFSHRLIWSCTDAVGAGSPARDYCVLDRIYGVCQTFPEKDISSYDCLVLDNYYNWKPLDAAIHDVIRTGGCLAYYQNLPPCQIDCVIDLTWASTLPGEDACK
jgi:hypothetical protein